MLSFNHCSHATESCSDKVYHCTDVHIFENTIKNMSALPRRGGVSEKLLLSHRFCG